MASFVTNRKTKVTVVTGSMQVKFNTGEGFIERIQAMGEQNGTSSLQHLSAGDVGPTSVYTSSIAGLIPVPNGGVVEGPLNEIRTEGPDKGKSTFLVFYRGNPTITNLQ